jgi:hypothetical protein
MAKKDASMSRGLPVFTATYSILHFKKILDKTFSLYVK